MPGRVARAGGLTREGAGRPFAPASKIELVVLPRAESLQLTVYNGADLTLVRERRRLVLTEGWNWLQFEWTGTLIDPTSLELEPVEHARQVEVEQLVYPAGLQGVGRWLIWSEVAGEVAFEMSWFVSGVSWRAFYEATLGEGGEMELVGHVRVDNRSGVDFKDAQVRLVVGEVNVVEAIGELARRQWPYGRPGGQVWAEDEVMLGKGVNEWGYFGRMMGGLGGGAYEAKQVLKEGLSEYQLYTIEGTQTLRDGWGTRLKAIEAGGVKVESLYRYDEGRYGGDRGQDARGTEDRGLEALGTKEGDRGLEALGTEEGGLGRAAAMRFLAFVNDREHELGENPLPEGQVRVYERAGRGEGLEYVGASWMKYVPVGEEVELGLGAARRVVVEAKLMGVRTENYEFVSKLGDVSGWEELQSWRVEVANTGAGPVRVELWRHFDVGNWEMEEQAQLGEGEEYERIDMDTVRYALGLGAGQRRELEYTVRLERGSRGLREADEQVGGIVEKLLEPLEFERDEVTR